MNKFSDAFIKGQEAAKRALAAKAEINQIINTVSSELSAATEGKLEIKIYPFPRFPVGLGAAAAAVESLLTSKPASADNWVSARNPMANDHGWIKLAQWDRQHEGYPCSITYDKREVHCHDGEALENALSELLASAWAGEKLRELIDRPLKTADPDANTEADDAKEN